MKPTKKEISDLLELQEKLEKEVKNFIGKINFYDYPFKWFNSLNKIEFKENGIIIYYKMEDDNMENQLFLPWKYFDNPEEFIKYEKDKIAEKENKLFKEKELHELEIIAKHNLENIQLQIKNLKN